MKKTAALSKSASVHSSPYRAGFGWVFKAPYFPQKPNGPCTEISASCYWSARQLRARYVARLALELMGFEQVDVEAAVRDLNGSTKDNMEVALARLSPPSKGA